MTVSAGGERFRLNTLSPGVMVTHTMKQASDAAATMELHERELEIVNMIYCHVVSSEELSGFFAER